MTPANPSMSRRTVLRGIGTAGAAAAVSALLAACTPQGATSTTPDGSATPAHTGVQPTPAPSGALAAGSAIPQELAAIPDAYRAPARAQGSLVELSYDTFESMSYAQQTQRLTKRAVVYLPNGYDAGQRYNVFYLMHGGWSNETTTLGTPDNPSEFTNVLDNAIAAGEIQPLIVVCPTYNNTSAEDSGSFSLALTLNENYHHELLNDLIPAVESTYASYADDVTPAGLMAARNHRGFGGFSMGAVAAWRTYQHALDYFRYFLPMSCGTSLDMDTILAAAQNGDPGDQFVWVITGTDDFARPFDDARVDLMRGTPLYTESDTEAGGNFAYRVKNGYAHDGVAASEYTYNGLRWFWSA
jgi:enterochelin esterase-like enzyme